MNVHQVLEKLAALRSMLPAQQEISDGGMELYARAVADLPLAALERAIDLASQRCKFFPTPVELRELAGEPRPGDAAILAWEMARSAISSVGAYRSVAFDDPLIHAAIRMLGGWDVLCQMTSDDAVFRRKDFIAAYETCARVGVRVADIDPLPGLHEMSGTKREPIRITSGEQRMMPMEAAQLAAEQHAHALPSPAPSVGPTAKKCAGCGRYVHACSCEAVEPPAEAKDALAKLGIDL